jgi:hypothetical protein
MQGPDEPRGNGAITVPWPPAFQRCASRLLPVAFVATVVSTGLTATVAPPPRPVVEGQVHALAAGRTGPGWSRQLRTGQPTEMVGVDWQGRHAGAVEVRAKRDGRWGPWQTVDGNPAEGPDNDSIEGRGKARTAAGPVWVGPGVRDLEVRVTEGQLDALRLHAIHTTEPAASGMSTASAATLPQPGIISRGGWGADESWRSFAAGCDGTPSYADRVSYAIVHHTVTANNYSPAESAAIVRGIYFFHTHTNGWCDIGYNFLVDRYGQVFEGRAGGITSAVVGAHAGGFNTRSTGIALIGDFSSAGVPGATYSALRALLAWKLAYHGVEPGATITVIAGSFDSSRYPAGTPVAVNTIIGHRDVDVTACPGDVGYGLLARLRDDVRGDVARAITKPLVVRNGTWYVRDWQTPGPGVPFGFGNAGDVPLMCDWNGDGHRTPGVFRRGVFYLRNSLGSGVADTVFAFGNAGDTPLCGDWNGDGVDTVGVFRAGSWYLRNRNDTGAANIAFAYGNATDVPVTGDWNGDGVDTPAVVRGGAWLLSNRMGPGPADMVVSFGDATDAPVVGDWNGDGRDTPGVIRGGTWYLRNDNASGVADASFPYGDAGDLPRAWR